MINEDGPEFLPAVDSELLAEAREMVRTTGQEAAARARQLKEIRTQLDLGRRLFWRSSVRFLVAEVERLQRAEADWYRMWDQACSDPTEDEGPGPVASAVLGWTAFAGVLGLGVVAGVVGAARSVAGWWR